MHEGLWKHQWLVASHCSSAGLWEISVSPDLTKQKWCHNHSSRAGTIYGLIGFCQRQDEDCRGFETPSLFLVLKRRHSLYQGYTGQSKSPKGRSTTVTYSFDGANIRAVVIIRISASSTAYCESSFASLNFSISIDINRLLYLEFARKLSCETVGTIDSVNDIAADCFLCALLNRSMRLVLSQDSSG